MFYQINLSHLGQTFRLKNLLILALLFSGLFTYAQTKKQTSVTLKGLTRIDGYFTLFYDSQKDKMLLQIDHPDEEVLYVNSLAAGVGSNDIGLDRGQLGRERVVKFKRVGPKVLMIQPNYSYRAISDNPDEVTAVKQAFAESILWGFKVEMENEGKVIVDATDFFLRDAHHVIERLKQTSQGSYKLDKSRSAFYMARTKAFPHNTEVEATLTFTGHPEGQYIRSVTPSPEAVTVREHHSLIKLPDNKFKPREFDPRAGYFGWSYKDYATPIDQPIDKRFITRHRLAKKNPSALMSEPVKPIIYYLDRGAPEPIRSALLDGARWWNQAFEAAGYKNAFQVKILPEGADPMDVRYNLIQWVHRSTRGWSYGSSVTDPRTGEIIKGHVSLGSLRVRQDFLIAVGLLSPYATDKVPPEMLAMALARLRQLAAHEVGHTLGLAHNYSASMDGRASVMDYPQPLVTLKNGQLDLSNAYDTKIGAWDKVAISYGYQDFPSGTNEHQALNAILNKAYKQDHLSFISDQDARPQGGAHPRAHLWDNGTDAADELGRMLKVRAKALENFSEKAVPLGQPLALLEESLAPVYFYHRYQLEAAVKLIGGLNYTYAVRGDGQIPTSLIAPDEQEKALIEVLKCIDPSTLTLPEKLIESIPPRPLGYRRTRETVKIRTGLTFDPIASAETAADLAVGLLLRPERVSRLVEHHARDSRQPSFSGVLDELLQASWYSKARAGLEGEIRHVVNGVVLSRLMSLSSDNSANEQARAIAYEKLIELKTWASDKADTLTNEEEKAHLMFAVAQINDYQNNPNGVKWQKPLTPPDGSPIGTIPDY